MEIKSEYTIKDVEKEIKNFSPKEIDLVYILNKNETITVKHTIK